MALLYEEKVRENRTEFIAKVKDISDRLGIDPNWLMAVMNSESALNHRAVNSNGGATGLIQFMPKTAAGLGTSTDRLSMMSNVEQLDWVYKYLKDYRSKLNSYVDLYLTVFFPVAVGKSGSYILKTSRLPAHVIARSNPIFDTNKDGKITKAEVEAAMLRRVPAKFRMIFKKKT